MRKKYRIEYTEECSGTRKAYWSENSGDLDAVFAEACKLRDDSGCDVKVIEYVVHDSWEFKAVGLRNR